MSDQESIPQAAPNTGGDDVPILTPEDHLKHLLVEPNKGGWWGTLFQSVRSGNPAQAPPASGYLQARGSAGHLGALRV